MSKATAGLDRVILFLIAVALIVFGLWPILVNYEVTFAQDLAQWIDHEAWKSLPEQNWYNYLLIGIAVATFIIGLWLIIINIRRRTFAQVASTASDQSGKVTLHVDNMAKSAGNLLETDSDIDKVKHKVSIDRKRPTVAFTIEAKPEVDLNKLSDMIEQSERDFRDAVEDVDLDTVYQVHLNKVKESDF